MINWDDQNHAMSSDPHKHVHMCADGCGSAWECGQLDGCPDTWVCPNCEGARVDHYWSLECERITAALAAKTDSEIMGGK